MISLTRVGPGAAILGRGESAVRDPKDKRKKPKRLQIRRNGGGAVLPALIVL